MSVHPAHSAKNIPISFLWAIHGKIDGVEVLATIFINEMRSYPGCRNKTHLSLSLPLFLPLSLLVRSLRPAYSISISRRKSFVYLYFIFPSQKRFGSCYNEYTAFASTIQSKFVGNIVNAPILDTQTDFGAITLTGCLCRYSMCRFRIKSNTLPSSSKWTSFILTPSEPRARGSENASRPTSKLNDTSSLQMAVVDAQAINVWSLNDKKSFWLISLRLFWSIQNVQNLLFGAGSHGHPIPHRVQVDIVNQ